VLYDQISREAAVRDQIEARHRDFQAPPGLLRIAIGARLIRVGLRLQGVEPRAARLLAQRPSVVARWGQRAAHAATPDAVVG
jgi:hypothetical protein